ncbi:IPT/TIG domain-containing protein [Streptomyces sp. NBC_01142]|uniref:IPT/TIG domain-containing protein n=1 Tax=Streptomyces sp. NBC_01142 TaxID=2975865 RepID=UPI0022523D38|nr:IPT/TIG domain-containing protein [Streptomyces sp. NBC_01142]MCX4820442.1 IPT/TIG domain-containing protein [Streptomyces sp. NBC_01142]
MENSAHAAGAAGHAVIAAAPALSSVVPNQGPAAGNNTVTLNGSSLTGATAVNFGPNAALGYTVNSSTKITAVAPPGTGSVFVTVTSPAGTSNPALYVYAAGPTLTAISPSQGPASGGTTVTLTGTGFTGATAVTFGSTPATSYTVNSANQITAVAPAGTGAVPVTVTTPNGTTGSVFFFYVGAPSLTSVSPSQGPTSGGTTVTLTGTGFTGATAVTFGSTPATSYTVNSANQITAVAPAGTGTVALKVTTPGGTSNSVFYIYLAAPVLTALSPVQGPTGPGAGVTLTGSGLTTTTSVLFGTTPAAFTVLSDTTVVASAPAGAAGPVLVKVTTDAGTSNSLTYTRVAPPVI